MTPDTNLKDKFAGFSPINLRIEPEANTQGCNLFSTTDEQDPLGDTGTPYTEASKTAWYTGTDCSACPDDCRGNGKCVNMTCICLEGFGGASCANTACPEVCITKQAGHHAAAAVGASGVHDDNMMAASLNNSSTFSSSAFESSATVFICAWGRYECALVGSTRLMLAVLPLLADTVRRFPPP